MSEGLDLSDVFKHPERYTVGDIQRMGESLCQLCGKPWASEYHINDVCTDGKVEE